MNDDGQQRLGGLSADAWDELAGGNFYSSSDWLGFCATDFGSDSGAVVVARDGAPACAVPVVEADDSPFEAYRWHDVLAGCGLPAPPPHGLLVGPREGYQTHVLGADAATDDELATLLRNVREVSAERGDAARRACVAMYATTDTALALRRAGATAPPVCIEVDAWIAVPEGGWDAWLAALSKSRRRMARIEYEQFLDAGYEVERVPLSTCWDELGPLASATLAKHGRTDEDEGELVGVLRNHATCMGDAARTALLRGSDGAPVGFCLYYVWGDTFFVRWVGFDYDRLADVGEYFALVYYSQIHFAAERGLRWIHVGVQSIEAKALRGALLRPLWLVDLTPDSVLAEASQEIRRHNHERYEQLKGNPRTAKTVDEAAWEPFL